MNHHQEIPREVLGKQFEGYRVYVKTNCNRCYGKGFIRTYSFDGKFKAFLGCKCLRREPISEEPVKKEESNVDKVL